MARGQEALLPLAAGALAFPPSPEEDDEEDDDELVDALVDGVLGAEDEPLSELGVPVRLSVR